LTSQAKNSVGSLRTAPSTLAAYST